MPLSWNEIKARAIAFAKEWADAADERALAQSFWIGFFAVFGLTTRRRIWRTCWASCASCAISIA